MTNRDFIKDNEASQTEMRELINSLDERSFTVPVGSGWTVATSLCHLAFWDQRALFLLRQWNSRGKIETSPLDPQSVESINQAVNTISKAVPGPAAGKLALDMASAVDSCLAGISDEFIDQLIAAGFDRYLRRCAHRREHLQKIRQALGRAPAPL